MKDDDSQKDFLIVLNYGETRQLSEVSHFIFGSLVYEANEPV